MNPLSTGIVVVGQVLVLTLILLTFLTVVPIESLRTSKTRNYPPLVPSASGPQLSVKLSSQSPRRGQQRQMLYDFYGKENIPLVDHSF